MENAELPFLEFQEALLQINRVKATEIFERLYVSNKNFKLLEELAINTLEKIGDGWEEGEMSLSQVYMSGVICEELIDKYLPKLEIKRTDVPKMAIGVLLDHHSLGKRIVYAILRAGGFEIIDFGQGLSVEEMVEKTINEKVEMLLISTLMLNSAIKIKNVKEKLIEKGANTRIIAGGAPFRFDKELWKQLDADADGKNASDIIKIIENLVKAEVK